MTVVFVHGVPETSAIWRDLLVEFGRDDAVALSPPGFGAPVPDGFGCTSDDYRDWLISEISALPGPIDLVGHDWGGAHVLRVVMERPDLIRSWCSDVAGIFAPEYKWHDLAQNWQTPGVGEKVLEQMVAVGPDMRAAMLKQAGMSAEIARDVAEGMNEQMAKAILPLYRGAAQPFMSDLGKNLERAAALPGLAIVATKDDYVGDIANVERAVARTGADVVTFEGLGHWWMCQEPAKGAAAIKSFLERVEVA